MQFLDLLLELQIIHLLFLLCLLLLEILLLEHKIGAAIMNIRINTHAVFVPTAATVQPAGAAIKPILTSHILIRM